MLQFAAIFVCLACMACAAPSEKPEAATVDTKRNQTEPTPEPKAVPTTGSYMSYPSYKALPWNPSTASYYSAPSAISSFKPYYPAPRNPNLRLFRPSLYPQAMPYSLPVQALQTVPIRASPYRPYAPYYSGFSHYRQANPMDQPEALIAAPTKVIIHEEPFDQSLPVMPVGRDQQMPLSRSLPMVPVSPDQQMPKVVSRDASVWSPEFLAQPQAYFGPMEDSTDSTRGIFVDDKQNMQIQPTYLINRLHMDPSQDARAAEEESNLSSYMPVMTDSKVYMVMNQYDQQPQVARAAYEEGTSYSIFGQEPSNSYMQPMPNREGKILPYMSQNIAKLMEEMYMRKYHQDLQNSKGRSAEAAKPSQPEKAEEKKETPVKA